MKKTYVKARRHNETNEKSKGKSLVYLIVSISLWSILIPIIIFNVILSVKAATNPDLLPSIFGIAPTAVMTGSMEPTIKTNDLIFIKKVDLESLKEKEDIICFEKDGSFIVHRIERIDEVNGKKIYYTKGDANNAQDRGFILAEQIQGEYVGRIAGLGGVIIFLQSPSGIVLFIILLVLLYATGELLIESIAKSKEIKKLKFELETLRKEN